jgi:hypothetical protein
MSNTPTRNTPRSLSDGEGGGNAGAKRKRSGTVRGRIAPLSLTSLDAMLPAVEEGELGDPSSSVMSILGTLDWSKMALSHEAYVTLGAVVAESLRDKVPMGNIVLARFVLADEEDQFALTRQIDRALNHGLDPTVSQVPSGVMPMKLWCRRLPQNPPGSRKKISNTSLVNDTSIAHRCVNNRSFGIYGQLLAFWPPPVVVGPGEEYDILWSFKVANPAVEFATIKAVGLMLGRKFNGMFFKMVRRMLSGLGSSVLIRDIA